MEREGVGITSQKYLSGTRLVRAFNTLSYTIFVREANRPDPTLAIPIASDDGEALAVAAGWCATPVSNRSLWASLWMRAGSNVGRPVTVSPSLDRSYR